MELSCLDSNNGAEWEHTSRAFCQRGRLGPRNGRLPSPSCSSVSCRDLSWQSLGCHAGLLSLATVSLYRLKSFMELFVQNHNGYLISDGSWW